MSSSARRSDAPLLFRSDQESVELRSTGQRTSAPMWSVVCWQRSKSTGDEKAQRNKMPTIEADIRFAMVPAIMARNPSLASSLRLLGASALMPPI
jgi:hypothetical protein